MAFFFGKKLSQGLCCVVLLCLSLLLSVLSIHVHVLTVKGNLHACVFVCLYMQVYRLFSEGCGYQDVKC